MADKVYFKVQLHGSLSPVETPSTEDEIRTWLEEGINSLEVDLNIIVDTVEITPNKEVSK